MTVTYKLQTNPDSIVASTITTLASNEVLDHIELIKTDFGFASEDIPAFMWDNVGFLHMLPPPFATDIYGFLQQTAQIATTDTALQKLTA